MFDPAGLGLQASSRNSAGQELTVFHTCAIGPAGIIRHAVTARRALVRCHAGLTSYERVPKPSSTTLDLSYSKPLGFSRAGSRIGSWERVSLKRFESIPSSRSPRFCPDLSQIPQTRNNDLEQKFIKQADEACVLANHSVGSWPCGKSYYHFLVRLVHFGTLWDRMLWKGRSYPAPSSHHLWLFDDTCSASSDD